MLTRQELLQNPDLYRDKARGALQKLWFERRQLHWEGLHNLIDDARVAKKYNPDKTSK